MMAVDVDNILLKLASKYRYQTLVFMCLGFIYARGSWNTFGVIFLAADVGQSCDDDGSSATPSYPTNQLNKKVNASDVTLMQIDKKLIKTDNQLSSEECNELFVAENGTNVTKPCNNGWIYLSKYKSTVVSEWNLVCVRAYLSELSTTIYLVGSMVGALVITPLSDKYGRRPVLLVGLLIQGGVGSAVSWAPNYELFTCLRFLVGLFNMGTSLCTYVMMTEIFPARMRTVPCIGFQLFWALGIMVTAFFGYMIQNWHYLHLAISLPNALCALFVWLLPESLPWLISQNKLAKAQKVMETISRINGTNPPNDLFIYETTPTHRSDNRDKQTTSEGTSAGGYMMDQPFLSDPDDPAEEMHLLSMKPCNDETEGTTDSGALERCVSESSNRNPHPPVCQRMNSTISMDRRQIKNISSLFLTPRIRMYSFILFYLFFVNCLSYFGISLSIPILHDNGYINLFLLGAVEVPAYILCIIVCARMGRKIPLLMFMLVCGFTNIVGMLISKQASSGMSVARVVFVMAGKFAITGAYSTVYLYACEIFPTAIRNHSFGMSSFFENIGSIAAPFIIYFAKSHQELPMVLFGLLSVVGGVTVFALPETQHQPLPQTVTDVESLGMQKRRRIV